MTTGTEITGLTVGIGASVIAIVIAGTGTVSVTVTIIDQATIMGALIAEVIGMDIDLDTPMPTPIGTMQTIGRTDAATMPADTGQAGLYWGLA